MKNNYTKLYNLEKKQITLNKKNCNGSKSNLNGLSPYVLSP